MSDIASITADTKPWYQSKTIIGSAVAVLGVGARLLGYEIAAADQATLIDAIATLAAVGGSLFAIYGRMVAAKAIGAGK